MKLSAAVRIVSIHHRRNGEVGDEVEWNDSSKKAAATYVEQACTGYHIGRQNQLRGGKRPRHERNVLYKKTYKGQSIFPTSVAFKLFICILMLSEHNKDCGSLNSNLRKELGVS